jgi:DNA-binding HxlR family transcriptional regulator
LYADTLPIKTEYRLTEVGKSLLPIKHLQNTIYSFVFHVK